ncbi:c-type cytochrome [Flavobacterium croceum]|uniref:Nitric oxide reductase subunit C n=1 Tax=Flavobacterium croceum DSM 17960 TaxID=1121886 RepID=A0A2S4NBQ4_9FLAO|nr:cytochrome c [Flavobacterium croceum]POS03117.1 nitric oxide reductase subunit C [Flavobacterium croceum DSM 17960]
MENSKKYLLLLTLLVSVFSIYNFTIYTSKSDYGTIHLSKKAINGENIWLKNNCNSCHQLYGLGGYLGPDLTNIYSTKGKGEVYIKAFIESGVKAMPKFDLSEKEKDDLVQFLKEADQTGYYPNIDANIKPNGWVSIKYKNQNYENK